MNQLIKLVVFIWLMICAVFAWVSCAAVGFVFVFTQYSFMYHVTPFIGLTITICIIKSALYVLLRSNPIEYFMSKIVWLENKFGKKV